MRRMGPLFLTMAVLAVSGSLKGQAVVGAHSGVVHFVEGAVFVDDKEVDQKIGSFRNIQQGSIIRTEKGRAEVLLTPGAFLRLDENSSIRLTNNSLLDTRLEFLGGSLILDTTDAPAEPPLQITSGQCRVRFPKKGVFRMDSDTGVLQVYSGEAQGAMDGHTNKIDSSHEYFLALGLPTEKLGPGTDDEFFDWARERSEVISAEDQLAAETLPDAPDADPGPGPGPGIGPYMGVPSIPGPSINSPISPGYGYNYPLSTMPVNPFFSYALGAPFIPYPVYPLVAVRRPPHVYSLQQRDEWLKTHQQWLQNHPQSLQSRQLWLQSHPQSLQMHQQWLQNHQQWLQYERNRAGLASGAATWHYRPPVGSGLVGGRTILPPTVHTAPIFPRTNTFVPGRPAMPHPVSPAAHPPSVGAAHGFSHK